MANTNNLHKAETALDLNNIRKSLRRMEDSIIFSLIERAQYRLNAFVYKADNEELGEFKLHQLRSAGSNGCYADYFLYQTECLHSQARRYLHPTENPFFGPLPEPVMPEQARRRHSKVDDEIIAPHKVNVNRRLLELYRSSILPEVCEEGDDGDYGSAATMDVQVLQTIATRIYYGLFVAESKFRSEREKFTQLIQAQDSAGLMDAITKPAVEAKIIERVVLKARTFSQEVDEVAIPVSPANSTGGAAASNMGYKLPPEFVGHVFQEFIMPLTKDVEVEYLLHRLDGEGAQTAE